MQKYKKFRNLSLKKALIRNNFPKSKSAILKDKSIVDQKNKKNKNKKYSVRIESKEINNFDSFDSDLNQKNEFDIAEKIYKANQLKIKENELEDEEINSINDEIRKIMTKNFEMQKNIQNQLNMRYIYEKNQKSIASYINDLNYKFRNYDTTIRQFESNIRRMKKENKNLQNEYDKKIEEIEKENEKLKKRIRDRIELYIHQKGQIHEKSAKTKNLENEINIQKNTIKERVDINKKKVDELENKYDMIYKKIIDIEVNCEDKKIKKILQNNLFTIQENKINEKEKDKDKDKEKDIEKDNNKGEVKEIHKRIEEYELNNDALLFELKELNKHYEELIKDKDKGKSNSKEKKQRYSIGSTMKSSISNFITQSENKFK